MTEKLKPCPFCGEDQDVSLTNYSSENTGNGIVLYHSYVNCFHCGAQGSICSATEYVEAFNQSVDYWNKATRPGFWHSVKRRWNTFLRDIRGEN